MPADGGRASLAQLQRPRLRTAVRGYAIDEVDELITRSIRTVECLEGGSTNDVPAMVTARELRDSEISEVFRGYNRDDVNHLLERAARTIDYLTERRARPVTQRDLRVERTPATLSEPAPEAPEPLPPVPMPLPVPVPLHVIEPPLVGSGSDLDVPIDVPADVPADVPVGELDRVRVDLAERSYDIVIGAGAHQCIGAMLVARGTRRAAIVTQSAIAQHADAVIAALDDVGIAHDLIVMRDGEEMKAIATVDELCRSFAAAGMLRGDAVVALGGGVVGDTAGFEIGRAHV